MSYASRLRELNTTEHKTVWDSIDRPIRPLIYELNRIGLKTKFSCCGFNYEGEEEPKSHSRFTFVIVQIDPKYVLSFFKMIDCVLQVGWKVIPYNRSGEWHIHYDPSHQTENFYREGMSSIHAYECSLLAIARLTELLSFIPGTGENIIIEDGNAHPSYNVLGGEWQVKPKPSIELTPDLKSI